MELTKEIVKSLSDKVVVSLRDMLVRGDGEILKEVLDGEVLRRMGNLTHPSGFQEKLAKTGHVPESPEAAALLDQLKEKKKKRNISAAGRKAISDASKRRWAKFHKQQAGKKKPGRNRK